MSKQKEIKSIHKKQREASPETDAKPIHEAREVKEKIPEEKRNLKDMADGIIASYETRVKVVGEIIGDTHKMMDDFKEKREIMAEELQGVLAKSESLRKKDFDRMMADIVIRQNEREKQVREMLENFRKEEEMVAEKLKKLLAKGEEIRIKDFKKMMAEIKRGQEKRIQTTNESVTDQLQRMQEEVHAMLNNFKTERQSVASAWHQMLDFFRTGAEEPRVISNPGPNLPAEVLTKVGPDLNEHQPAYAETASAGRQDHKEYEEKNKIERKIA